MWLNFLSECVGFNVPTAKFSEAVYFLASKTLIFVFTCLSNIKVSWQQALSKNGIQNYDFVQQQIMSFITVS